MEFLILGPLDVLENGKSLPIAKGKQRVLLAILITHANQVVSRERLSELLWGEDPPATAINVLQVYVSQLRRVLEPHTESSDFRVLVSRPAGYMLCVEPDQLDVNQFEQLSEEGRAQIASDPQTASNLLSKALAFFRGPALDEFSSEPFALGELTRLNDMRLRAIEDRIQADLALGRHAELVPELERLTIEYPLRERLRGQLMLALYRSGRQAEASTVYHQIRELLVEETGMDPSPGLARLLKDILNQEESLDLADKAPAASPRTNLRLQLSTFIGRATELAQMDRVLPQSRLLTLTGPGGIGKTRLATEAARRYVDDYRDGVWLVELGPLESDRSIPLALADVLGLQYGADDQPGTQLASQLKSRHLLVVLDNCEHRLPAVAEIVERLLVTCPDLKVLATSREALGVAGETTFRIGPLSLPDAATGDLATTNDAVALFRDRALATLGSFAPDASDIKAIGRICGRLEGIPLAIELAAARLGVLSLNQLERGLVERFQLLAGGGRTVTARQQTLRGAIDWSYDLLSASEQAVLNRLSVFAGSFTLEGAGAVCAGESIQPGNVTDHVYALVRKSLVVPPSLGEGHRYHILETIREYTQEKLRESAGWYSARCAHRDWYLVMANRAGSDWNQSEGRDWIGQLELERDNLLSAAHFALEEGDLEVSNRLGSALGHFQRARALHAGGAGLQPQFSHPSAANPTVSERPAGPYRISGTN